MGEGRVLQEWMKALPWKQQSVILSSLRGPDTHYCPNIKKITRWLRRITQHDADPSHTYMQEEQLPSVEAIEKEFEFSSVHFASHFLHGLEIIGYKHPEETTARIARQYYERLVTDVLHLNPETQQQMEERLQDTQ